MFYYGLLAGMGIYWILCAVLSFFIEFDSDKNMVLYGIFGGPIIWIILFITSIVKGGIKVVKKIRYKALVINTDTKEIFYANDNWEKYCHDDRIVSLRQDDYGQEVYKKLNEEYRKKTNSKSKSKYLFWSYACPKSVWKKYPKLPIK